MEKKNLKTYQVFISRIIIKNKLKHTNATQRPLKHFGSQMDKQLQSLVMYVIYELAIYSQPADMIRESNQI